MNWFLNLLVRNVIEREIERERVQTKPPTSLYVPTALNRIDRKVTRHSRMYFFLIFDPLQSYCWTLFFLGKAYFYNPLCALWFPYKNWHQNRRIVLQSLLKFMFSKKATKIDTDDLTSCCKCQIVNFCGLLKKHKLYL